MKWAQRLLLGMGLIPVLMAGVSRSGLFAADATDASKAVDNSAYNKPENQATRPTADNAKNNASDRETMRQIRKSIIADKSLSTYGHNVKVIAENGHVTLKGTVHTETEKSNIAAKARAVAGTDNVTNDIQVKGS